MLWIVIKDAPFVIKSIVDGVSINKTPKHWTDDENKLASYDLIARNILISTISTNVYFLISYCKTNKTMWDGLQVLNELKTSSNLKLNLWWMSMNYFLWNPMILLLQCIWDSLTSNKLEHLMFVWELVFGGFGGEGFGGMPLYLKMWFIFF